jgi:hypothetical protein
MRQTEREVRWLRANGFWAAPVSQYLRQPNAKKDTGYKVFRKLIPSAHRSAHLPSAPRLSRREASITAANRKTALK